MSHNTVRERIERSLLIVHLFMSVSWWNQCVFSSGSLVSLCIPFVLYVPSHMQEKKRKRKHACMHVPLSYPIERRGVMGRLLSFLGLPSLSI